MTSQPTLPERLTAYLREPQTLQACYGALPDAPRESVRRAIYENLGRAFRKVARGVYLATNGATQALILEGDAWERIPDIADASIDFIVTDAPYTPSAVWAAIGTTRKKTGKLSYALRDMDAAFYAELWRVLKPSAHCYLFFAADAAETVDYNEAQRQLAQAAGFRFNKRAIWDKVCIGMGYNGRNRYEQILFLSKGKRHMPYDLSVPDVLSHKRPNPSTRRHEAEKPVELLRDLLRMCAKPGDVGLDPFTGSHNFIEACQTHGCHSITIELDTAHVAAAVARFGAVALTNEVPP